MSLREHFLEFIRRLSSKGDPLPLYQLTRFPLKVGAGYIVISWLVLMGADWLQVNGLIPGWIDSFLPWALVIGYPLAIISSWIIGAGYSCVFAMVVGFPIIIALAWFT